MAARFDRPIAHRGRHDRANGVIENSASAFELAIAGNFGIECDLQLTRDGVAVLFHDDRLTRLTGLPGFVRDLDAATLCTTPLLGSAAGDCPQRLVDFLAQIGGRTLLQIELKAQKGAATAALAAATTSALASYAGPVTIESFDPQLLVAMRRAGFIGPLGIIVEQYVGKGEDYAGLTPTKRFALRHLLHWPWSRFDFISCDKTALDLPAVKWWAGRGMPLTAWTIRSPAEAAAARQSGAQIVFEGFDPST
ncbi:MAG: Glycerophosphoryl diester phosphodiesterase [Devosia sp.]|nr:Glycerophosphoryl diester phosphodiesterase [Devosia sp.]